MAAAAGLGIASSRATGMPRRVRVDSSRAAPGATHKPAAARASGGASRASALCVRRLSTDRRPTIASTNFQAPGFGIVQERADFGDVSLDERAQETIRDVSAGQPDDLGRRSADQTQFVEVGVLADDGKVVIARMALHHLVGGSGKTDKAYVRRTRKCRRENLEELIWQVLIEQELQGVGVTRIDRRSRSAAKARHARMSSGSRSG